MLDVSDATKEIYDKDGKHKVYSCFIVAHDSETHRRVELEIPNNQIKQGSIKLKETLMTSSVNLEFVGGNSSTLEIEIYGLGDLVAKGAYIQLKVQCEDTEEIVLFTGLVDSAKKDAARRYKKITAYDILYFASYFDVADWYNKDMTHGYGYTLYTLVPELMEFLRTELHRIYVLDQYATIEQVWNSEGFELINGNIPASLPSDSNLKEMSCLDLLKHIAQINACFVKVNRLGQIEFKYLTYNEDLDIIDLYPSNDLYPSSDLYPGIDDTPIVEKGYRFRTYEEVVYEDFSIKNIENVTIRDNENDEQSTTYYGHGEYDYNNTYIIQGNLFAKEKDPGTRLGYAEAIYTAIEKITFVPFSTKNRGMPFLECGDEVIYKDLTTKKADKNLHFYIMRRDLSGDQVLKDRYEASGDEYQSKFISNLSAQLEKLTRDSSGSGSGGSGDSQFRVESVDMLPDDAADHPNTIYLIRGLIYMA